MIRRILGETFSLQDTDRYLKSMKMPTNTEAQRAEMLCFRRYGLCEEEYLKVHESARQYALKRVMECDELYDYYFGLAFRFNKFVSKLKDITTFFVSPYKGCRF